tara:strand:+ start:610 stop:834 length:225 start_codon:yes stop_codon:yes gene_type:complete
VDLTLVRLADALYLFEDEPSSTVQAEKAMVAAMNKKPEKRRRNMGWLIGTETAARKSSLFSSSQRECDSFYRET